MNGQLALVFAIIGAAAALMASNRVRFDIIALLVMLALIVSGILTPARALAGFGSPVVILVAALLVVGEMLDRTGVARAVGDLILKKGGSSERRLLVLIMAAAAMLGAVMSSTAIVAIFIPIVLRIAAEARISPQRLLIPVSYAALISGMLTLIATAPNLVVSEELKAQGMEGFGFFSFTPIGLGVLVVAIVYFAALGRWLLPGSLQPATPESGARRIEELLADFHVAERIGALRIGAGSPLAGKTIAAANFRGDLAARVIGIMRSRGPADDRLLAPGGESEMRAGDILLLVGDDQALRRLVAEFDLEPVSMGPRERQRWRWEQGSAAVLIHPESRLIGKSVREIKFRSAFGLHALGLRHAGNVVPDFEDAPLRPGDSLLVVGPWSRIDRLQSHNHDFIVTELPRERAEVVAAHRRMPAALIILVAMVLLVVFNIVPLVAAVIMALLAAVFTGCLGMDHAYRSIHWSSIVLVAGMLPLADALEVTGGIQLIVDVLMRLFADGGPRLMLTAIFLLTAAFGLILSNTAAAVLVAPIAIYAARALDVSPYPFAVAVLIAASAAYSTPVSTPVVTLVVEPGRYRFIDFIRAGAPLLALTWLLTLALAPVFFPFEGFDWPAPQPEQFEPAP
ncbi:MAG: SLC13 family permease [Phycisphaerales bacterium JB039]